MLMKSLAFVGFAAFIAGPALAQDNPQPDIPAPAAEIEAPAPSETEVITPESSPQAPPSGGIANQSLDDLKSGIQKGEDLPGCRSKNEHVA